MTLINLDLVISAITSVANPLIKEKILRSQTVIKLLQQFNLDPEHPPADFSGVYAYALVEYGVGKPKAFLELFCQETIKLAFRRALDHNNPSIVLSEVYAFLDAHTLGDEIRRLHLDVKAEVARFATIFIEVAKRTRTPADVLMNQKIGSIHQRIATITEQLERLPTLEGIRTEIARLAAENQPALAPTVTENKCRAIALAQQMRGWFETLGYRFEKYEIWGDSFFEWIINVPTRRNRYDRILIRGIEGEVGLKDIAALRSSVEQQRTDEGWLVTARRIARAARDEVEKEENRHLGCYTFDELIDQDADFSDYLDWLEAEITRRKIDTKYVPLACTKEEIDFDTKQRIGVSRYDERDGWIDGYIDMWLDDPAKEHISVLGEFGTGKTWFAFHYAWVALQRYRDAQRRGVERPRLPLIITLRDFAKAINVENVLAGFFFTQHNIRLNSEVFDQLNNMGKLLLIFDGFDEMAAKVDRQQMINNFWELAKVVVPGSKVILTCRTEHFPEAKEGRALLNAELQASTKNLTGETPQFEVLELEKFNDEQIRVCLSYQAQATTVEQVIGNPQLLDLARRPVMTELILEALPDIEAGKPVDMSRVYLYAVQRKMERDIKSDRTFTSLADKLYFLCELSWEMLSTDQMSLNYRLFPDRIRRLFGSAVQEEKDLDHWHYDMMAQTMLVRNADGDYTPAHRSLLEFFVAYKFAAELGVLAPDFTELAKAQSCLDGSVKPVDYTWSGYFSLNESDVAIASLKEFRSEPLDKLRETFGRSPLTKAVMDLLLPMLRNKEPLIKIIEETRSKSEDEVGYLGGNAATLVVKVDKAALEGRDLSGTVIKYADFSNANLCYVNFTNTNLADSVFTKILSQVFSVTFSPDGQFLATGGADSELNLWQTRDNELVWSSIAHKNVVRAIVFSPDGKTLASGGEDCHIKFWDIQTGKCLKTLIGHTANIRSITFSPDGKILASGGEDYTVKFWSVSEGECLKTFNEQVGYVRSIAFSPDGKILAYTSNNYSIELWNTNTKSSIQILQGHTNCVKAIAFSPNGKFLASAGNDYTVKIWDIYTGQCLNTFIGHVGKVNSVAFHFNSQMIVTGSADRTVKVWDISKGQLFTTLYGHTNWVQSVSFSPDGRTLASGGQDHTVKLWDIYTNQCLKTLQGHCNWIKTIAFSPDGRTLASGGQDYAVRLWDINTAQCIQTLRGHIDWVMSVVFSPDGHILASSSNDKCIRLWNISTGQCLNILQGHTSQVRFVNFNSQGTILASSSHDNTVRLWDVVTGRCLNILQGHTAQINFVTFNLEGQFLFSNSEDQTLKLWNIHTGSCLKSLSGELNWVRSIAFSPDYKTFVASGSEDYILRIWDIDTGQCIKTLSGHQGQIQKCAFNLNGQIIVSGSDDHTVKLWDVDTGQCIKTLFGHTKPVSSVIFSPDGKIVATCSEDGTIKLWSVESGDCLKILRNPLPYENMNITGVKGLTLDEIATLKTLGAVDLCEN
ncbi:MAG: NACHT domain-containing protein [Nostoc sp. DedQUE01]